MSRAIAIMMFSLLLACDGTMQATPALSYENLPDGNMVIVTMSTVVKHPDYSFDTSSIKFTVTGQYKVDSVSGELKLLPNITTAQSYCVSDRAPIDVVDCERLFNVAGCAHPLILTSSISTDQILLRGTDIPTKRYVMLRNAQNGVSSFQILVISFIRFS